MLISVSAKLLTIPHECCCCGTVPSTEIAASASKKTRNTTYTKSWNFPYCTACALHVKADGSAGLVAAVGIVASIVCAFVWGWFSLVPAAMTTAAYVACKNNATSKRTVECVCSGPAVYYQGWHGTFHTFVFVSHRYASAFLKGNRGKLVNVTHEHRNILNEGNPPPRG